MPAPSSRNGKYELSNRQWEIHQGTNPATNPGASTKKIAEPTSADTFLMDPMTAGRSPVRNG